MSFARVEVMPTVTKLSHSLFVQKTFREATALVAKEADAGTQFQKLLSHSHIQSLLGQDSLPTLAQAEKAATTIRNAKDKATSFGTLAETYFAVGNTQKSIEINKTYLTSPQQDVCFSRIVFENLQKEEVSIGELHRIANNITEKKQSILVFLAIAREEVRRKLNTTASLDSVRANTEQLQYAQPNQVKNYLTIAAILASEGKDYHADLQKAKDKKDTMTNNEYKVTSLCSMAKTAFQLHEDPTPFLEEALGITQTLRDGHYEQKKSSALGEIAREYVEIGDMERGIQVLDGIASGSVRLSVREKIARRNIKKGFETGDLSGVLSMSEQLTEALKIGVLNDVVRTLLQQNDISQALSLVEKFTDTGKLNALTEIAKKQFEEGEDYAPTIAQAMTYVASAMRMNATSSEIHHLSAFLATHGHMDNFLTIVRMHDEKYYQDELLRRTGTSVIQAGKVSEAIEIANLIKEHGQFGVYWDLCGDIAILQFKQGNRAEAIQTSSNIGKDEVRMQVLEKFAEHDTTLAFSPAEIADIPQDTITQIVDHVKEPYVLEAIGFFGLLKKMPKTISPAAKVYILLGKAEETGQLVFLQEARSLAFKTIQSGVSEGRKEQVLKAFVQGIIDTQEYEIASSNIFGLIDAVKISLEEGSSMALRVLKGLIELDNPRGKALATEAFTRPNLPEAYQKFIAEKLFKAHYWDPRLHDYLQQSTSTFAEQASVLNVLIHEFGLTPDLPSYLLLEKPGYLQSETLQGRISEAKEAQELFEGTSHDKLVSILLDNERLFQIFYVTNVGKHRYSIINDYTQEKFKRMVQTIAELQVDESVLRDYQDRLFTTFGKDELKDTKVAAIMADLIAGRPLVLDQSKRTFSIDVLYEGETEHEVLLLQQLHTSWHDELEGLLIAMALGTSVANVAESNGLRTPEHRAIMKTHPQIENLLPLLTYEDELNGKTIETIAAPMREILLAKVQGTKAEEKRIKDLRGRNIIIEYLQTILPPTDAFTEWSENFLAAVEGLDAITSAKKFVGKKYLGRREMELTFLDKNIDFVRAIRFADAARCCFNSTDANIQARSYKYVTRLNKDPLSFIMDLTWKDTNDIVGFIFGRLGIDPRTQKPVIILNGLYSQLKNPSIVNRILDVVEQQMGVRLQAESIVIASKNGGLIHQPKGYKRKRKTIRAMRALKSQTTEGPERELYDDIGTTANGEFEFRPTDGFTKILAA